MKKARFLQLLADQLTTLQKLTASKGVEYARSDDDQLANFKRHGVELGLPPLKVLAIFLNKHLDAVKSYIKTGEVLSEPIESRIDDAILYLILLKAMIEDTNAAGKVQENKPRHPHLDMDAIIREIDKKKRTYDDAKKQWPFIRPNYGPSPPFAPPYPDQWRLEPMDPRDHTYGPVRVQRDFFDPT